MNILVVADVLKELYYNGIIRSNKKLDERDFLQLAKAAKGSIIRSHYFQEKQNDSVYQFLADNIKEAEYNVKEGTRGRILVDFDFTANKITRLPEGNGILRITPLLDKDKIDYSKTYTKGVAGSEYLYCTKAYLEDTGLEFYIAIADQIRLFVNTVPKMVEMMAVVDNDDSEIPDDVVWEIFNNIFNGIILKLIGVPIDTNDDSNPVVQAIKSKLGTPQPI